MNSTEERIVRWLLVIATLALGGLAICAAGWWRAANATSSLDALSSTDRQRLAEVLIQTSPGIYRWTWFEPRIGYTLKPDQQLTAWDDSFLSNELGFRTGPVTKSPGTFRVVFVGDSWTYGMGVSRAASFPEVFARFANQWSGEARRVEAWTLALPGYNLLSGLSALDFFFERIQPDAVVICPSGNDNHSTPAVLPNGSLGDSLQPDALGEPHAVTYRQRQLNTYRFRERWRTTWAALGRTAARMKQMEIPVLLAFIARWDEPDVHHHLISSGVTAPFFVVPPEYTVGPWEGPPPIGHGNEKAHQLYGRWVYVGLAELLGWAPPPPPEIAPDPSVHPGPIRSADRSALDTWSEWTRQQVPEAFRPGQVKPAQRVGRLDPETGTIGRATTLLIRPNPGARWLHLAVRRIAEAPSLYPLPLKVSIPSPGGGRAMETVIPASSPEPHRFSLEIPQDIEQGSALDVVLEAERAVADEHALTGRSLIIESIVSSDRPSP